MHDNILRLTSPQEKNGNKKRDFSWKAVVAKYLIYEDEGASNNLNFKHI